MPSECSRCSSTLHTTGTQAFALKIQGSHANQKYLKNSNTGQSSSLRPTGTIQASHTYDCRDKEMVLTCSNRGNCKRKVWTYLKAIMMENQIFIYRDSNFGTAGRLITAITAAVCHRHTAPVRQKMSLRYHLTILYRRVIDPHTLSVACVSTQRDQHFSGYPQVALQCAGQQWSSRLHRKLKIQDQWH